MNGIYFLYPLLYFKSYSKIKDFAFHSNSDRIEVPRLPYFLFKWLSHETSLFFDIFFIVVFIFRFC